MPIFDKLPYSLRLQGDKAIWPSFNKTIMKQYSDMQLFYNLMVCVLFYQVKKSIFKLIFVLDPNSAEDPVYSDPLDALEKAEDTRIYNFPDFGDEEPIYEEAKQKKQNGKCKVML
jgi:hypothetical protein